MKNIATSAFVAACAALLAATGLLVPAGAQQPPAGASAPSQAAPTQSGPAMGPGMMQHGMDRGRMGQAMGGMMDRDMMSMMMGGGLHTEGRLAFIKAELKINDAQMPQWNAFAEAVRANATAMVEAHRAMSSKRGTSATLPERLAAEDKAMSVHLAAHKKVQDSLTKLYEALTPEQRKVADGIVIGPMGMPMGMM